MKNEEVIRVLQDCVAAMIIKTGKIKTDKAARAVELAQKTINKLREERKQA